MNPKLDEFFKSERTRVFEPGPYFTQRVMARLAGQISAQRENGIWDGVLSGARPVFALALVLLLAFMAIQLFLPDMPVRGPIDPFFPGPDRWGAFDIFRSGPFKSGTGKDDHHHGGRTMIERTIKGKLLVFSVFFLGIVSGVLMTYAWRLG
jgi:hypothetical protein